MKWEHKIIVAILLVGTTVTLLNTTQKPRVQTKTVQETNVHIREMAAAAIH